AERRDRRVERFAMATPPLQPRHQLLGIVWIAEQEIVERRRIFLRDTGRAADDRGNAAAQRFTDRQAVRFVPCGMDERVHCTQQIRYVAPEAGETNAIGAARLMRSA